MKDEWLWVYIEDQGEGVSPTVMEKIWDPFFTTKEKGTGLGLGIVRNIVEAHDGMIRIENRRRKRCSGFCSVPAKSGELRNGYDFNC